MDRRSFLRRLGLVGGAAVIAPRVLPDLLATSETAVAAAPVVEGSSAIVAAVAAGGLCAPLTPYYSLAMLTASDRPIRSVRRPMTIVGHTYLERGRPVVVRIQWGKGGGPRNVLVGRETGELVVRPFRGLRKVAA